VRAVEVCIGMLGVAVLLGWLSLKAVSPMPRFAESWLLSWWVLGSAALLLVHHLEFRLLRKLVTAGRLVDETVAVVGSGPEAVIIVAKLLAVPGIALAGVFDDRRARAPQEVLGVPVRGGIADLAAALREIDRIIITFPLTASRRIGEVVKRLSLFPVDIGLAVDIAAGAFEARGGTRYGTFVVDLVHPGLTDLRHLVKRVEDIILASILVVLFTPLLLVIAIAIKLDSPGPVLFRQPRQGQGGQVFQMLKFRTMYISATDVFGDRLTEVDDQRITRFGRLLRKSSLDELPQLFNVLRGDMSVVGPRPHALRAKVADVPYADAVETYAIRLRMKPGITGWAQVNGWRGETHTVEQLRKRVIHDLDYMNNWSIWWDLYIIGRTAFQILFFFSNNALVRNAL
jgi:Undecaprenyl-phosphate glucose phosphotransferase